MPQPVFWSYYMSPISSRGSCFSTNQLLFSNVPSFLSVIEFLVPCTVIDGSNEFTHAYTHTLKMNFNFTSCMAQCTFTKQTKHCHLNVCVCVPTCILDPVSILYVCTVHICFIIHSPIMNCILSLSETICMCVDMRVAEDLRDLYFFLFLGIIQSSWLTGENQCSRSWMRGPELWNTSSAPYQMRSMTE